ncbi:hypothetical protein LCGC14_1175560 [marine sediment metagenome]|uniref:Uncharacterized protein n=1 Tax=marine sediment metagenome TaxID=412755 RepID=A0A0F9MBI2_9ZZZZ
MEVLPKVGNLEDESDAPWVYLAITSRGAGSKSQGIRLVVDVRTRLHAIQMGQSHYTLLTKNIDGDHYKATLVEEWAYNVEEAESLQWEAPKPVVVLESDDVTIIEIKRKKKR